MKITRTQPHSLQSVINSLPMGILGLDVRGKCLLLNHEASETLSITSSESVGRPILELVQDTSLRAMLSEAIAMSKSDRPYTREITLRGRFYDVQATVVRESDADDDHVIVLFEDLSKTRQAHHKKDEFLALISHELRTPLTVIKGYLEILGNGMMGELPKQQAECIDIMHDHCVQLETLIKDLIRFGTLARGEVRAAPEPITLFPFLQSFSQTVKGRLKNSRMSLSLVVPDPMITCLCDVEHLRDALRHLVENAIKFSATGDAIQVCATKLEEKDLPPVEERIISEPPSSHKKWVRFEVIDRGQGIPPERITDIFNSFEQVENYMTRKSRGLGLGLAFVKEIVKAYEGTLWIQSEVGKGTNVAFILPRIDRQNI